MLLMVWTFDAVTWPTVGHYYGTEQSDVSFALSFATLNARDTAINGSIERDPAGWLDRGRGRLHGGRRRRPALRG